MDARTSLIPHSEFHVDDHGPSLGNIFRHISYMITERRLFTSARSKIHIDP